MTALLRDLLPLAPATVDAEAWTDVRRRFLRYWERASGDWANTRFFGYPVLKLPTDLWVYQELITAIQPDVLVETGSCNGGSALYFAAIMDLLGRGQVLSIDLYPWPNPHMPEEMVAILGNRPRPQHQRVTYLTGSSIAPEILAAVRDACAGKRVLVVLDSDHSAEHVRAELDAYAPLVSIGSFLVVEDTGLSAETNPAQADALGAAEALAEWLPQHPEFVWEPSCERFLLTSSPGGWLKRTGASGEG